MPDIPSLLPDFHQNERISRKTDFGISENIKAYGVLGLIKVNTKESGVYNIYSLLGSKVASGRLQPDETSIPVKSGFYIFNSGGYSTKVVVK